MRIFYSAFLLMLCSFPLLAGDTFVQRVNNEPGSFMTCPISGTDARLFNAGASRLEDAGRLYAQANVLERQGKRRKAESMRRQASRKSQEAEVKMAGVNPHAFVRIPHGESCFFTLRNWDSRRSSRREVVFKFFSEPEGGDLLGTTTQGFTVSGSRYREDRGPIAINSRPGGSEERGERRTAIRFGGIRIGGSRP